ncbi:MAG: tryptophan synthase subunit alpha [Sandaracinaceae bacterium]
MSRLADAFERARAQDRAALVIYLCAGDPSLELAPLLIARAAEAGADVIELGVPFSDPVADGPTIQRASERALARGASLAGALRAVELARASTDVPIVLFGYYNPIVAYGEARMVREAARVGVDGMLVVDLPIEHADPLRAALSEHGLDFVPLVAPNTSDERATAIGRAAGSFVYCVSMTGVTGAKSAALEEAAERAAKVRALTSRPVAVGFGVRTPADVATLADRADGIVVGSAVVEAIADATDAPAALAELVSRLAAATRRGRR